MPSWAQNGPKWAIFGILVENNYFWSAYGPINGLGVSFDDISFKYSFPVPKMAKKSHVWPFFDQNAPKWQFWANWGTLAQCWSKNCPKTEFFDDFEFGEAIFGLKTTKFGPLGHLWVITGP